jgi:hypothetical protein
MKTNDDSFFADTANADQERDARTVEVLSRLLIWMADAPTFESRGVHTTVALYCVRPDLIGFVTQEAIAESAGCTPQAIAKLVESFRLSTGFES